MARWLARCCLFLLKNGTALIFENPWCCRRAWNLQGTAIWASIRDFCCKQKSIDSISWVPLGSWLRTFQAIAITMDLHEISLHQDCFSDRSTNLKLLHLCLVSRAVNLFPALMPFCVLLPGRIVFIKLLRSKRNCQKVRPNQTPEKFQKKDKRYLLPDWYRCFQGVNRKMRSF